MSLHLPSSSSSIRNLFDLADLAAIGQPGGWQKLPSLRDAINGGRNFLAKDSGAKALHSLVLRADGSIALHKITRQSQHEVWNFGKP